jgi:hypothetical protein
VFTPGSQGVPSKDGTFVEHNVPDGKQLADAITQGDAGSCAFLAGLIGLLRTRLASGGVKVQEHKDGTYRVKFPGSDVQYKVSKPTETEMLRYATAGKNGLWLSVLEKAYAQFRGREADTFFFTPFFSEDAFKSLMNPKLGSYPRFVIQLLTGKDAGRQVVQFPTLLENGKLDEKEVGEQLEKMMGTVDPKNRFRPIKTIAIAGSKRIDGVWDGDLNKSLPPGHAFAVVGYDPEQKEVMLQNPYNRKGTKFGSTFSMKLKDFVSEFAIMASEKP